MKTNAINNRESFLFKSLFGQTLDEMDAYKYEDFFNSLIHIECSNYGTFYDKTGTYFIIPAKNYIDCNIYRVVGSSHEDNKYCSMDYELVDRTDIFEVDESFNSEGIYLDKYIKNSKKLFVDKISYLKKKYKLNGLYYLTDFSTLYHILKLGYVFSENEKKINNYIEGDNYETDVEDVDDGSKEKIEFEFIPNRFKNYEITNINNIRLINSNLYLPIPVYLIFDEELILWDTSEYVYRDSKNMDYKTGDSFEFFNSVDWDKALCIDSKVNLKMSSTIPIPLLYCKKIVFSSLDHKNLAINLFGESEKFSVDAKLFGGEHNYFLGRKSERITLTLNKDELGFILHSYETYFSNMYSLKDNGDTYSNEIFHGLHPIFRYSIIKDIYDKTDQLNNFLGEKAEIIRLLKKYKNILNTNFFNNLGSVYFKPFESYKKYYAYYLINNSWELLIRDSHEETCTFKKIFNELIVDTLNKKENCIENNFVLYSKDIDNTITIMTYYILFTFIYDLKKEYINSFDKPFALEILSKLIEFKDSYFSSDTINIGDIVLLKDMDNLKYKKYMVIDGNFNKETFLEEDNIIKATLDSEVGRVLINSRIQDTIKIEDGKTFKIIDIIKENKNDEKFILNIVESYMTNNWSEGNSYIHNTGDGKLIFRDETPLKQTGYSIWDGNRRRTREERLHVLISQSIPILGLNEVISTIQSHIYFKKDKGYALQEWEHDLEELKKIFYREDKVNYFD